MMVPSSGSAKCSFSAAISAAADCSAPRSDQSLKVGKASAALSPWPEKLKPEIRNTEATASRDLRKRSSSSPVASVRTREAPGGSCTSTTM